MSRHSILVVDDNPDTLDNLVSNLSKDHHVVGCRSGQEAVNKVEAQPHQFEFVVVDHLLNHGPTGIETAQNIADISDDIFILVFTNVPASDQETLERHRSEAFAAGAHRYMERADTDEQPLQVQEFVEEMEQLSELRERIRDYYDQRQTVPSLLTQLDLGVDIVDRAYKVWYMNRAMRRITGHEELGLPRSRCSSWHGHDLCPCPGCLVEKALGSCKAHERIFLSPIKGRGEKLFYLLVWAQPVVDTDGRTMIGRDKKPLAVMETVRELNGTEYLRSIGFVARLKIIAQGIHERLQRGYRRVQPFQHVAIYALDPRSAATDQMELRAIAGYPKECEEKIGSLLDHQVVSAFDELVQSVKDNPLGRFSQERGRLDPIDGSSIPNCIDWPVIAKDGRLVAFIRARGEQCSLSGLDIMKTYAEEVLVAFEESKPRKQSSITVEAERRLLTIDNQLQTIGSPEEALHYLVEQGCKSSDSYSGHVRERRGNEVVILRLGAKGYDAYERVAKAAWPLTHRTSWSARTVLAGAEQTRPNLAEVKDEVRQERKQLSPEAVAVLENAQSWCFEPLVFENRCIGVMGFHSEKPECYSEDRLWFLRQVAHRASLALHDLRTRRKAEERLQSVKVDTVLLLLHNINNPLAVLWNRLDLMGKLLAKEPIDRERCREVLDAFADGCGRISKVREDLTSLLRPIESSRTALNIHEVIGDAVGDLIRGRENVQMATNLSAHLNRVEADELAIRTCIQTLVQNALDEFDKLSAEQAHVLTISLRDADEDEAARLATHDPCFAIEVQDNGPGVPADIEENLFTVIRSRKSSGLGVGLAKCRNMARAAGGEVYLDRNTDAGAKFILLMPYANLQGESNG